MTPCYAWEYTLWSDYSKYLFSFLGKCNLRTTPDAATETYADSGTSTFAETSPTTFEASVIESITVSKTTVQSSETSETSIASFSAAVSFALVTSSLFSVAHTVPSSIIDSASAQTSSSQSVVEQTNGGSIMMVGGGAFLGAAADLI